ncbi:ATP-dependent DNA helicase RecG [Chloroflexota bacterium]
MANVGPLRMILELEHKKGYKNSSVYGGLDRFLQRWSAQAIEVVTNPQDLRRFHKLNLVESGYAFFTQQQRKQWVKDVLDFLTEMESNRGEHGIIGARPPLTVSSSSSRVIKSNIVSGVSLDSPITFVKGVNSILANRFRRLGVETIRDLLFFFPHRHLDYSQRKFISQLIEGDEQTIIANVWQAQEVRLGGRRSTEAIVGDETGNIRVVWFNQSFLAKKLLTHTQLVISGKVNLFKGRHVFQSPQWELVEDNELIHTGRLVPQYSLTQGLHPRQVRRLMKEVVDRWSGQMDDFLPTEVRERCCLLPLPQAISQAHYPEDIAMKDKARVRLAFDELFLLQLGVLSRKHDWQESQPASPFTAGISVLEAFLKSLPFTLTFAQRKVLDELLADLAKIRPMSRLLQGEVGSGKTVVAISALLVAAANGYQGAFMAPTEILAEQHFTTICRLLSKVEYEEQKSDFLRVYAGILPRPLTLALLLGSTNHAKKRELQKLIMSGDIDVIIGTHALIQKGIRFRQLGLVVVDEQHRFGVAQRSELRQKGSSPHMLVMTATPIPRTLALTLYGDLDLSVIDQLPPGRQVVKTKWLKSQQRDSAYLFTHRQVASGHQAFIICPLIEESETVQARAAVAEYYRLSREVFPELKLGLLHGRMSMVDKDKVMRQFRSGELDILVSTPVVEVGIDVPNATVMLVESADRFGLSQLHQFRGRVGRGQEQSYCMFLAENPSDVGKERLKIIEGVQDGFQLAEEDLKLRGPGEFFGTRQSGLPDLRMAKFSDVALLELARSEAIGLFNLDPDWNMPENRLLAKELNRVWQIGTTELS